MPEEITNKKRTGRIILSFPQPLITPPKLSLVAGENTRRRQVHAQIFLFLYYMKGRDMQVNGTHSIYTSLPLSLPCSPPLPSLLPPSEHLTQTARDLSTRPRDPVISGVVKRLVCKLGGEWKAGWPYLTQTRASALICLCFVRAGRGEGRNRHAPNPSENNNADPETCAAWPRLTRCSHERPRMIYCTR